MNKDLNSSHETKGETDKSLGEAQVTLNKTQDDLCKIHSKNVHLYK